MPVSAKPFALAEVGRRVGLDRVTVSDHGGVALTTGGDPDPWLDPVAMEAVTDQVARTLSSADPAGRDAYHTAAVAFLAQLAALDIDYRSSLADCARHDIVAADQALARTGSRYGFTVHAATDPGVAGLVKAKGISVVFTETGVPAGPVEALAQATGARVDALDTMVERTVDEVKRGATYLALMGDNLDKLRRALACSTGSSG
jgi:zinc transport system substrate-binding protein